MHKRIDSIEDIERIKMGDTIFYNDRVTEEKEYMVHIKILGDLFVTQDGMLEIWQFTNQDLLSGNWWVKI